MAPTSDACTLQDQAYQTLRQAIVYAQFTPGQRLVPKDICEELGLGRTPVRESLVRLQQQGLVRTVPQSGTFVSRIDGHAAENARFTREHLESQVAIECCAMADEHDLARLDAIIAKQQEAVAARDEQQFFITDNQMHEFMFDIANRHEVWEWLALTNTHFERFRWLAAITKGVGWDVVMDQHFQIRDAIARRSPSDASYLVSLHLHKALADHKDVVAEHPVYFEEAEALLGPQWDPQAPGAIRR